MRTRIDFRCCYHKFHEGFLLGGLWEATGLCDAGLADRGRVFFVVG
jgi:hypothetical protein